MINIILDIQQNLNAPKNLYNKFGGYTYRSCENILVALKPLLLKHKAIIFFKERTVEQNGWHYIEATACLRAEGKEEVFTTTGYAREDETRKGMDASQITGSASSYARKYALNAMFAIDDVKDSDATNKHGKEDAQNLDTAENVEKVLERAKKCTTKKELTDIFYSLNTEMQTAVKPTFSELKAQFK